MNERHTRSNSEMGENKPNIMNMKITVHKKNTGEEKKRKEKKRREEKRRYSTM